MNTSTSIETALKKVLPIKMQTNMHQHISGRYLPDTWLSWYWLDNCRTWSM